VSTKDHNRLNSSARMVLNINRESMADVGFSPPTRIFEAAGAGACVITDSWNGISKFFAPRQEILVASGAENVVAYLSSISPQQAATIGQQMLHRARRDHTYAQRAAEIQAVLEQQQLSEQAA
jgi:spore maturation protein CgeB